MSKVVEVEIDQQTLDRAFAVAVEDLVGRLGIDPSIGLNDQQVLAMRERFGTNSLPEAKPRSRILLFLEQFNNPLIYILFGAAILTLIVADPAEAITIFFVVVFNAIIGYVQEQRASERLKAVKSLTAPSARVWRSGCQSAEPAENLVIGDVVLLESGVRVPADLRLLESAELTIDESILTGESMPSLKKADRIVEEHAALGDRINTAFGGTTVRKGRGRGIVVGIGAHSQVGRISQGIASAELMQSPLQERLARFGTMMAVSIGVVIVVIFVIGTLRHYDPTIMLLTSIGLAVSAIPEGLPIAVTVALSIGVYRMARSNSIVRKMNAVETLGSTTVVCSDKTGTLTRNQMTTVAIVSGNRTFTVTGGGYDPTGSILDESNRQITLGDESPLQWTLRIGYFCSESSFVLDKNGARELVGDPTEGAMMVAAEKTSVAEKARARWRSEIVLPFESERMYMVASIGDGNERYYLLKGSVERLLDMCDRQISDDGIEPIDVDEIGRQQYGLSKRGLRVIATAFLPIDGLGPDPNNLSGCVFAGMHGIEDPPRDEARQAIKEAHDAGIKVVMITGDHIDTARSIARQLEIGKGREIRAIGGVELEGMSDDDLFERVTLTDVYARVSPDHKLRIVRQMQRQRQVVAMTGDGVNDAPALKQADIGIAMGSGTDIAKEAAAMVVQDDNFATIISAIRYGRVMFRNLQHMVLYVLCTSTGGVLTLAASIVLGFPLPAIAVQLLWINLVTDGTSTIPLAYENEHGDIMSEPPRNRSDGLLNWQMGERIVGVGLVMMLGTLLAFELAFDHYGYTALSKDIPEHVMLHARTVAFTTLALFQIWNVHNSRSLDLSLFQIGLFSNRPLMVVTILAVTLQVAAVELPMLHPLLKTTGLALDEWILSIGISGSLVVLVELRKWAGQAFLKRQK